MLVRQHCRGGHKLAAGDTVHDGAHRRAKWDRNTDAHTPGSLTPAGMAQNGGEPELSGGDIHGPQRKRKKAPQQFT